MTYSIVIDLYPDPDLQPNTYFIVPGDKCNSWGLIFILFSYFIFLEDCFSTNILGLFLEASPPLETFHIFFYLIELEIKRDVIPLAVG